MLKTHKSALIIVFLLGAILGAVGQRYYDTQGARRSTKILSDLIASASHSKKTVTLKKLFSEKISTTHYDADACIVWCFDPRFKKTFDAFVARENYRHVDEISLAGGAKDVLDDGGYAIGQIKLSCDLHRSKEIILMVHISCRAYDKKTDPQFYVEELVLLQEVTEGYLKAYNHTPKVRMILAQFDGPYEVEIK